QSSHIEAPKATRETSPRRERSRAPIRIARCHGACAMTFPPPIESVRPSGGMSIAWVARGWSKVPRIPPARGAAHVPRWLGLRIEGRASGRRGLLLEGAARPGVGTPERRAQRLARLHKRAPG